MHCSERSSLGERSTAAAQPGGQSVQFAARQTSKSGPKSCTYTPFVSYCGQLWGKVGISGVVCG